MKLNKKNILFWGGAAIIGASAGFAYYYFIGCQSGTCPITSKWYNSTGYGILLGLTTANLFSDILKSKKSNTPNSNPD